MVKNNALPSAADPLDSVPCFNMDPDYELKTISYPDPATKQEKDPDSGSSLMKNTHKKIVFFIYLSIIQDLHIKKNIFN